MDFLFTEEQQILKDSVRRLSGRYFSEKAFTWEDEYPWENAKILAENGLMGVRIPIEDGGQGGTLMDAVIAIIEITKVCPHTGDVFQAGNFGAQICAQQPVSMGMKWCLTAARSLIQTGMWQDIFVCGADLGKAWNLQEPLLCRKQRRVFPEAKWRNICRGSIIPRSILMTAEFQKNTF